MTTINESISTTSFANRVIKNVYAGKIDEFPKTDRYVKISLHSKEEAEEAINNGYQLFEEELHFPNRGERINFYIKVPFSRIIKR